MTNAGGIATLTGIRYEILAVLWEMPDLLEGTLSSIRYQPRSTALAPDQESRPVFTDDYAVQTRDGKKRFFQAKFDSSNASWTIKHLISKGVLPQFRDQHRQDSNCELVLTSNIPSPDLQALATQARQCVSAKEYEQNLPQKLTEQAKNIQSELALGPEEAWGMLRLSQVNLLTEEQIRKRLSDYAEGRYADPYKFAHSVKDLIETTPGQILDRQRVRAHLESKGMFRLPTEKIEWRDVFKSASGVLRGYRADILGVHIERSEVAEIEKWVQTTKDEASIAFLVDTAGAGKSVLMRDLLLELDKKNIAVLALKADVLASRMTQAIDRIDPSLPSSPESLLTLAAKEGLVVLLIDQVDALSVTFSRNQECLDRVISLIGRALTIPNVRVVVSCRSFDRRFDPKLRQIQSTREFTIQPLNEKQIGPILAMCDKKCESLSVKERKLLEIPLHLNLWARIRSHPDMKGRARTYLETLQDLYDALWDWKLLRPDLNGVGADDLQDVIYTLVDRIHQTHQLHQPSSLLDGAPAARSYLESEGILEKEGTQIRFFHQSFFDYAFARRFIKGRETLEEYLKSAGQGLFVRAQVVQILGHLRLADARRYRIDLGFLLDRKKGHEWLRRLRPRAGSWSALRRIVGRLIFGEPVRYHLRRLAYEWFGQQTNLSEEEKALAFGCLDDEHECTLFLLGSRGNSEVFILAREMLERLLVDGPEDAQEAGVRLIGSVQEACPEDVYGFLSKLHGRSTRLDNGILWCLNTHNLWTDSGAAECLLQECRSRGEPFQALAPAFGRLGRANPSLGCKALRILLDRRADEWERVPAPSSTNDSSDGPKPTSPIDAYFIAAAVKRKHVDALLPMEAWWLEDFLKQAGEKCPKDVVDIAILPWLFRVLPALSDGMDPERLSDDALFSDWFSSDLHGASAILSMGLRIAILRLAADSREAFLEIASKLQQSHYLFCHQVLIESFSQYPERYAQEATSYLMEDTRRFGVGDGYSGAELSRKLIAKLFPHLTEKQKTDLEGAITSYYPPAENKPEHQDLRGLNQLGLLSAIPENLLSPQGRVILDDLRKKFPEFKPSPRPKIQMGRVRSPIPEEKLQVLSDVGWMATLRQYDDNYREESRGSDPLRGGIDELATELEKQVEQDPRRFASLSQQFDGSVSSRYIAALLRGLARSKTCLPQDLFAACERFAEARPSDQFVQEAVCTALLQSESKQVPESLIEIVRSIALTAKDPDREAWKEKASNGNYYYQGDIHANGINTIRGEAIRAYVSSVVGTEPSNLSRIFEALECFAASSSSAVRSCLIEVLPLILRFDSAKAVGVFNTAVRERSELLACRVSYDFIYYALPRHTDSMLPHIEELSTYPEPKARESAGRLATLAVFETANAKRLFDYSKKGDASLRAGVVEILASNVSHPEIGERCMREVMSFVSDPEKEVRQRIGSAFRNLMNAKSPTVKLFVRRVIKSSSLRNVAHSLVEYAERIQRESPELALEIAAAVQSELSTDLVDIRKSEGLVDQELVRLTVSLLMRELPSHLAERALDLFEGAMMMESHSAREALQSADR